MNKLLIIFLLLITFNVQAEPLGLINIKTVQNDNSIALTLDACAGKTDWRILNLLRKENIKATIFVTKKWLDKNEDTILYLKENADIFHIENHGKEHKEAVLSKIGAYHLSTVENIDGLREEVEEGNKAIEQQFGYSAHWYRDAGALYDKPSLEWLKENQWKVAGYSVAGDEGATASKARIIKILANVKPNDVILIHMNKPDGNTFDGLKASLPILKEKGLVFQWLEN